MNCKYLKQKLNRKLYCKKLKRDIKISNCSNCIYKEYRPSSVRQRADGLHKKSKRLAKLERNRESLFSNDSSKCMFCGSTYQVTKHEIFRGRNRQNSMKYKLVLFMCLSCHELKQEDKQFNEEWHIKGQKKFNEVYPELDFVEIFKRNYLD